jgi:hypothetical protein
MGTDLEVCGGLSVYISPSLQTGDAIIVPLLGTQFLCLGFSLTEFLLQLNPCSPQVPFCSGNVINESSMWKNEHCA